MTAVMMAGFKSEMVELEKEAGFGKLMTGLAIAGTLGGGAMKAAPGLMAKARPAITQMAERAAAPITPRALLPHGIRTADPGVADAMRFR